jgi:proteasome lid subunit RPN8/RPN11
MDPLKIDRSALDEMLAHARETHPDECCGAVVSRDDADRVLRFTNIQNRLHAEQPAEYPRTAATAYTPEPRELLAAIRAGEEPGARLSAFYHSHAVNGAYFSGEDRARALFGDEPAYPDVTYVVVSDARTRGEVRAFRWSDEAHDFVEAAIEVRES